MGSYDYIYGSKVIVQCKDQLNINPWKGDVEYSDYLKIIKKDTDFFPYWCKPRTSVKCIIKEPPDEFLDGDVLDIVGTKIDDMLIEQVRAVAWTSYENPRIIHVPGPGRGHGKQQVVLNLKTFCARDKGFTFRLPDYTSVGSPRETTARTATK